MSTTTDSAEEPSPTLSKGDTVEDFSRFHSKLQSRLNDLQEWLEEAHDSYYMEAEYTPYEDGSDRVSVTIDSDDFIFNKGEMGDDRYHIILGERGGLKHAERRRTLGGRTDYLSRYDTISSAWHILGTNIRRAK